MTYLSQACAALVLVQAAALEAQAQTPPAEKKPADKVIDSILKQQDKDPRPRPAANTTEAVREKIRPCWAVPSGKQPTVVAIRVEMNRDATPARAEVQDRARYAADADFRRFADAAVRTVMNPRCQPWPLPPEKYDSWRTITFNFDSLDYR